MRSSREPILEYVVVDATQSGEFMSLGTILLVVLILLLVGVIPTWPHSKGWGYGPSGVLGLVLVVIVVLLLMGRL